MWIIAYTDNTQYKSFSCGRMQAITVTLHYLEQNEGKKFLFKHFKKNVFFL